MCRKKFFVAAYLINQRRYHIIFLCCFVSLIALRLLPFLPIFSLFFFHYEVISSTWRERWKRKYWIFHRKWLWVVRKMKISIFQRYEFFISTRRHGLFSQWITSDIYWSDEFCFFLYFDDGSRLRWRACLLESCSSSLRRFIFCINFGPQETSLEHDTIWHWSQLSRRWNEDQRLFVLWYWH